MLAYLCALTLTAALSQAGPTDLSLAALVPAEAEVVVRVRSLQESRKELDAMIRAMSPALAVQAGPTLDQALASFTEQFGEEAARTPFLTMIRVVQAENPGNSPFAVLVPSDNYQAVLQSLNGGKAVELKQLEGYDSFQNQNGQTWFSTSTKDAVAFGPDETLVKGVARSGEANLEKDLTGPLAEVFAHGDVAVYVKLDALATRYKETIEGARDQFMAMLDQAGQQAGNADSMDMAKKLYGKLFDGVKYADDMTLSLDFAEAGLDVDSVFTVKPDSKPTEFLTGLEPATVENLDKLPAAASYFVFSSLNAELTARMQALGTTFFNPTGKTNPAVEAAIQAQRDLGQVTNLGAVRMGEKGMQVLNVIKVSDPKAYLASSQAMMGLFKTDDQQAGGLNFVKDIKIVKDAQTYKGFTFDRIDMVFDVEKMTQQQGNAQTADMLKKMFGGGTSTTWLGTDGSVVLSCNAPSWELAVPYIDAYLSGQSTVGSLPGFQAVMARLPKKASFLMLMSAQGLVEQIAMQLAAATGKADVAVPADMPRETAFLGMSVSGVENGLRFHGTIPSAAGPVFENGLVPMIMQLQGRVDR